MNTAAFVLSVISTIGILIIGVLQWRTAAQRNRSGEALDWSTAAKNMREENMQLREDLKNLKQEFQVIKELARRIIKNPPEKGEVIVLTPVERSLLYETGPKIKVIEE